ncbi:MAG TPA: META domain-containing protein [Nocardioides sp.]|nr:META domain-containing protein [Nocardioides sp.]
MTRDWAVGVLGCVLVGALVVGCGDDSDDGGGGASGTDPSPSASAEEAALTGTFVTEALTGHELVEGSELTVAFEDGSMAVSAGCNTLFGAYVDDDGLHWEAEPASTLKACDPELSEQDDWLTTLFTEGLDIEESSDTGLVLTSGDIRIELSRTDTDEQSDYAAVLNGPSTAEPDEVVQLTLSNLGSSRDSYQITVLPADAGEVAPRHATIEPGSSAKVDIGVKTTPLIVLVESAGAGGFVDGFTIR